jgi:hypothetical protein
METNLSYNDIPKSKNEYFKFFLNLNELEKDNNYLHPFLCSPTIPLLGKYNRETYTLSEAESLIILPLTQEKKNGITDYKYLNQTFNLPEEIKNILISPVITENNTKSKNINFVVTENIIFHWAIIKNTLQTKNKYTTQNNESVYNIVPHYFLFRNRELDFSKQKRYTCDYPITLIPQDKEISKFTNQNNSKYDNAIKLKELRIEYSSIHLVKGALGLSPNNLRFILSTENDIVHFFIIILDENNFTNYVFYYWICNSELSIELCDKLCYKSENLNELINSWSEILKDNEAVQLARKIFNLNN